MSAVHLLNFSVQSASQFNREYSRFFGQPPMRDICTLKTSDFKSSAGGVEVVEVVDEHAAASDVEAKLLPSLLFVSLMTAGAASRWPRVWAFCLRLLSVVMAVSRS